MPLETERPGLFYAMAHNVNRWRVVAPHSPEPYAAPAAWRATVVSTNLSWKRAGRAYLRYGLYLVSYICVGIAISAILRRGAVIYDLVAIVSVSLVAAGITLFIRSAFDREKRGNRALAATVHTVNSVVAAWATDETPVADVWELSVRLGEAIAAREELEAFDPNEYYVATDPATGHPRDQAFLTARFTEAYERFESVAERVGFEVEPADG